MLSLTAPARLRAIRRPLVWLIVLALVAYGQSATLVQLLGPAHRHAFGAGGPWADLAEQVSGAFHALRAWRAELNARLLPYEHLHAHADGVMHAHADGADPHPHEHARAPGSRAHAHDHATYQRHHHDPHDGSVIAIDALSDVTVADAASQASAGSASLPLALAPHWRLPAPGAHPRAWPAHRAERWSDAAIARAERPPRG